MTGDVQTDHHACRTLQLRRRWRPSTRSLSSHASSRRCYPWVSRVALPQANRLPFRAFSGADPNRSLVAWVSAAVLVVLLYLCSRPSQHRASGEAAAGRHQSAGAR
jgi:hypothetical protein